MSCLGIELFGYNENIQFYEGRFSKLQVKVECHSKDWTGEKKVQAFFVMLFALTVIATRGQLYRGAAMHLYPAIAAGTAILAVDAAMVLQALRASARFRKQVGEHVYQIDNRDRPELNTDDDDLAVFHLNKALEASINDEGFKDKYSFAAKCIIRRDKENAFVVQYFETNALLGAELQRYEKAKKLEH